jgi:hypothetical protein
MNAHVHVGFAEMIQFALMLIITGFFFRTLAAKFPDSAMGKALSYIY